MRLCLEAMLSLSDDVSPAPSPPSPALGRQQLISSQQIPPEMSMCQEVCGVLSPQTLGCPLRDVTWFP